MNFCLIRQFTFTLFTILLSKWGICQRHIDIATEITSPLAGMTFQSPQNNFIIRFKVYNFGPDTVRTYDTYQLRAYFGGEIRYSSTRQFPKDILPGSFDTMAYAINFSGELTINNVDCCIRIAKFGTLHSSDLLLPETKDQLANNESCIKVNHIGSGVNISENSLSFQIFPNPTNRFLNINPKYLENIKSIHLIHSSGKTIEKEFQKIETYINLDLEGVNSGVYTLMVKCEDGKTYQSRFFKI